MIKTTEEAVFKRPISLFWKERVRKMMTPALGNRPSARFGGRFRPLARTTDKTGWILFSKRAEGRSGTRLGNWRAPVFKAV
jgi:hypothetical protein